MTLKCAMAQTNITSHDSALEIGEQDRYNNDMVEIVRIYNQIKIRKIRDIESIENTLNPLVSEHPELQSVLDIVSTWKPKLTEGDKCESGNILQG